MRVSVAGRQQCRWLLGLGDDAVHLEYIAEEKTVGSAHVGLSPQTVAHLPGRLVGPWSRCPLPNKREKLTN